MTRLSTPVTTVAVLALALLLTGCGEDSGPEPTPPPPTSTTTPSEPTPAPTTSQAAPDPVKDLTGTWRDDDADWTVHFAADGTYVIDYQGHKDFLTGTWMVEGATVTLEGLDGYSQVGTIGPEGIVFDLGTLTQR